MTTRNKRLNFVQFVDILGIYWKKAVVCNKNVKITRFYNSSKC